MTAEEDMKHVLSYVGYMALYTRTASGDWERKFPLKTKKYGRPNGYTIFNESNWCTGV